MSLRLSVMLVLAWLAIGAAASAATPEAVTQIDRALHLLGADQNTPRYADATVAGHVWMLEQTGDLNGGWSRYTTQTQAHLDLVDRAGAISSTMRFPILNQDAGDSRIRFGSWGAAHPGQNGAWFPASATSRRDAERYLDLFPTALLIQARQASDAAVDRAGRIVFTRADETVSLLFREDTGAPAGFEIRSAYPDNTFLAAWGQVTIRGAYAFWFRDRTGVSYPRQTMLTLDGRPWMMFELAEVAFTEEPSADLSPPVLASAPPPAPSVLPIPFTSRREPVAPDVFVYRGAWSVGVLERAHDLVVFDAVLSPAYTRALLAQLAVDFPGKPVIAAFNTSNAWPHAGGVGGFAAAGVPLYGLEANRDLVDAFIQRANALRNTFHPVRDGFRLDGVIVRTSPGPELRNMMFLVTPDANLVWASDAVQLEDGGVIAAHARQYVAELLQAVCDDIRPDTLFLAMHAGPVSASDLARQFAQEPNPPCQRALN